MNEELTRDTQIGTQAGSRLPRREPREGAVSRRPGCCNNLTLEKFRVDQKKFHVKQKVSRRLGSCRNLALFSKYFDEGEDNCQMTLSSLCWGGTEERPN